MSGAGPHFPNLPYGIVRLQTSMMCSDIIVYNMRVIQKLPFTMHSFCIKS